MRRPPRSDTGCTRIRNSRRSSELFSCSTPKIVQLTNHRSGGFRLQAFSEFVRKIFYDFDCFYRRSFVFHQIVASSFYGMPRRPPRRPFSVFPFRFRQSMPDTSALCFSTADIVQLSCGAMPPVGCSSEAITPTSPFVVRGGGFAPPAFPGDPWLLPDGAFAARDGRPGTLTGGNLNAWNLSRSRRGTCARPMEAARDASGHRL